jgi:hypothetical protein
MAKGRIGFPRDPLRLRRQLMSSQTLIVFELTDLPAVPCANISGLQFASIITENSGSVGSTSPQVRNHQTPHL